MRITAPSEAEAACRRLSPTVADERVALQAQPCLSKQDHYILS